MDNTSTNIQQLKEMHSKLQNLNTNVTNAIGRSREFHSKLEGKLQESLSKLQENLDQSITTDRVQQNEKILLDIHSHFETKCQQIEEQNLNLVKRLRLMERQEEDYKNQIVNLNGQLIEKGLKGNVIQSSENNPSNFSFKANGSQQNLTAQNQNGEYSQEQLEESFFLKNEIEKLNKEIEILMEEKKTIMEQQQQNQQYLHEHQIVYSEQLYQSELSTGSKKPCKANQINVLSVQENNLQSPSKLSSPMKKEHRENHQLTNEEQYDERQGTYSPSKKPHSHQNIRNDGSQIRLISPSRSCTLKNSIHQISPSKVGFSQTQSATASLNRIDDFKDQNLKNNNSQINELLVFDYEAKLQLANKELKATKELQQKQIEELLKERDIRIQMQLKLEELEAEKRYQNLTTSNNSFGKIPNMGIVGGDSFSSPNPNQATLCHTPQRHQAETSNGKQFNNQNSLGYSSMTEYTSPNKSASKPLTTTQSYSIDTSNTKFQPIHTTLKLNKLNNNNNTNQLSSISNNESNYTYQMSVSPNKTNQNKTNSSNRSSQDSSGVQQQLIEIISKLQTSMSNKKRSLTPLKDMQKQIESAKKFDNAMEGTLSQLKQILVIQENQQQQNSMAGSSLKQENSYKTEDQSQSNQKQFVYNNSYVYTTDFNANH